MERQKLYPQIRQDQIATCSKLMEEQALKIIVSLGIEDLRFGDLQERLGVSSKTLSSRLKFLEGEQIITRTSYAEIPPRVVYGLSPKGRELAAIAQGMLVWQDSW